MSAFTPPSDSEIKEIRDKYNEHVQRINAMSDEEIDKLIAEDRCPYQPEFLKYAPIGMHHCPLCGEMVLAGLPHVTRADMARAEAEYNNFEDPDKGVEESLS